MENEPLGDYKYKYKQKLEDLMKQPSEEYKKICCPSCHAETPADNININDKIAKCNDCNIVFPFHAEVAGFVNPAKVKHEIIRPEGIDLFYFEDDLDITIQQPLTALEVIAVSLLPTFAILFTLIYFTKGIPVFWPVAFWLPTLYSIINLINRPKHKIYLTIDDRNLAIKWRPKKFVKDRSFPIQEIDQIYAKSSPGLPGAVYMVINGVNGQKHVPLISGLDSLSKARYLEQEIERHLGIADRPVPEESV